MWSVVIPVKGTSNSKSRFGTGDNRELAIAMALDTVCAALAAEGGVFSLVDPRGRQVLIPAEKLAYVEIGESEARKVGFGTL